MIKKHLLISFIYIILFCTSACGIFNAPAYDIIKIGMTKEEVISIIGSPSSIVSAKRYQDGILEIFEYITPHKTTWYYFMNNELDEWGPKEKYIHPQHKQTTTDNQ